MVALTTAEIQFIDRYLINSGVDYIDVRLELTDHIAATLEKQLTENDNATFYDVFKDYMVVNKKRLLKSDFENSKVYFIEITHRFLKGFLKLDVVALLLFAYFIINKWKIVVTKDLYSEIAISAMIIGVLGVVLLFWKERKISLGAKVVSFVLYPFYILAGNPNPINFIGILVLIILSMYYQKNFKKKIQQKIGKRLGQVLIVLLLMILMAAVFILNNATESLITIESTSYFLGFQLVAWYVMYKMLWQYKKEINQKYQLVLILN